MHGAHFWLSETSWLSESGVLTKRDMQNMQRGGARGLELRTAGLNNVMSQEDILGLAISLILDQFSIVCDFN